MAKTTNLGLAVQDLNTAENQARKAIDTFHEQFGLDASSNMNKLDAAIGELQGLVNGWKQYKDLAELGVSLGSEDIANIFSRMQDRSEITFGIATSTSNTSQYPAGYHYGQVWMRKLRTASGTAVLSGFKGGGPFTFAAYYNITATPTLTSWFQTAGNSSGTWTPELLDVNGNAPAAYTTQIGYWSRMANTINLWGTVQINGIGDLDGFVIIPIPSELQCSITNIVPQFTVAIVFYSSPITIAHQITGRIANINGSSALRVTFVTYSGESSMQTNALTDNTKIYFQATYLGGA